MKAERWAPSLFSTVELCTAEVHVRSGESFGAERSRDADRCEVMARTSVTGRFWDGSTHGTDTNLLTITDIITADSN